MLKPDSISIVSIMLLFGFQVVPSFTIAFELFNVSACPGHWYNSYFNRNRSVGLLLLTSASEVSYYTYDEKMLALKVLRMNLGCNYGGMKGSSRSRSRKNSGE